MTTFSFPELDAEQRAVYELFPINLTRMMLHTRGQTLPYWRYALGFRNAAVSARVREQVIVRVATIADCKYQLVQHKSEAARTGSSEEVLAQLTDPEQQEFDDPAVTALIRYVDSLVQSVGAEQHTLAMLRQHFPDNEVAEITLLAGTYVLCATFLKSLQVRWGPHDQLGTVNLITADKVREAAKLVNTGRTISLTMPYDERGPQTEYLGRANPHLYQLTSGPDYLLGEQKRVETQTLAEWRESIVSPIAGYYDDVVVMPTQAGTQWDALCHFFWRGQMYNGHSAGDAGTGGSRANGVQNYTGKIVTRGVFVDLAEHRGVHSLDPGYAVTVDDLEDYLDAKEFSVGSGDALIIRTGFMGTRRDNWGDYAGGASPGLSLHTAPWLRKKDVAAVATGTWGIEVLPNEIDVWQPLHVVSLTHTGLAFEEMFDLDALSDDCRADGVYEFMFVASPLPITGASGSPVSALAIK